MTHYITIRSAAKRLDVHENTVRNWIDKGLMAARRLPSGTRQLPLAEVERIERAMIVPPAGLGMEQVMQSPPKSVHESAQERFGTLPTI